MTNNLTSLIAYICRYLGISTASIYYTYLGNDYMNIQMVEPSTLESLTLNLDNGEHYTRITHPHMFDNARMLTDNSVIAMINHYLETCDVKRQYIHIMATRTASRHDCSEYRLYMINGHTYTWCMTLFLSPTEENSPIQY